jgi:hypothetical protein
MYKTLNISCHWSSSHSNLEPDTTALPQISGKKSKIFEISGQLQISGQIQDITSNFRNFRTAGTPVVVKKEKAVCRLSITCKKKKKN